MTRVVLPDRPGTAPIVRVMEVASMADEPVDQQLVVRIADGDTGALGELVRRHQRRVLSLSYRMLGRWDQAEEASQEVFLKVYRAAPKYRPDALFTTWLYRIVVNQCLDMKRKAGRDPVSVDPASVERISREQDDRLEARERARRVLLAVAKLPQAQRTALLLHRFEGRPIKQIAEVMGKSGSAVESLLVRAYARLRELLADMRDE